MKTILFSISLSLLSLSLISQGCLPEGITFTTQEQIDNFQTDYPGCTEIEGDVIIQGNGISNLNGLNVLTYINGFLLVGGYDASTELTNLEGLDNLDSIGGNFLISSNLLMTSLEGLSNLTTIGGTLDIEDNNSLISLSGLDGLTSIGGYLNIWENFALNSITALRNVMNLGGGITITQNYSLSNCDVQSICNYLIAPSDEIQIENNAPGCNSQEEVEEDCANNCLPDGIGFETQEQIDNFKINYPGCSEIEGSVTICSDNSITNLDSLHVITEIGGNFNVTATEGLQNLVGLDNLTFIHGDLGLWFSGLNNLDGLGSLHSIGGSLDFNKESYLQDISALANLTTIRGDVIIGQWGGTGDGGTGLINLEGLEGLDSINGSLWIIHNYHLTDISALDELNYIGGSLKIVGNDSLAICQADGLCNYLFNPNGTISISGNAPGCNSQEEVEEACSSCLPEGIEFTTQEQIDNFQTDYPGCTEIEGNVIIQGDDITNLNGLSIIKQFSGNLRIGMEALAVGNPLLVNLSGLENVTYVGGDMEIMYNESLNSITALESLSFIKGSLRVGRCNNLYSLEGLNSLDTVGGLGLSWIWSLENLSGLENLKFIDGALEIVMCNNLRDLSELSNLVSINGGLWISNNWILNSLSGLDNINAASINDIFINANDSLSECDIRSICEYLIAPNGDADFINNAPGCNNQQEVEDACASSIQEVGALNKLSITPNPFSVSTTLSYSLKQPSTVQLSVFNQLGQLVYLHEEDQQQGEQQLLWDAERFAKGIYYYRLEAGDQVANGKMVKLR